MASVKDCVAARYVFAVMAMLGMTVAYALRVCLNIVITQMVPKPSERFNRTDSEMCADVSDVEEDEVVYQHVSVFNWDEHLQGIILSAFYLGYIITHVPGVVLAQKIGAKRTFGIGILLTGILTLLSPTVVEYNVYVFIVLRFIMGIFEGTSYPALYTMLAYWAPPKERSAISSFTFTGIYVGTIVATFGSSLILQLAPGEWHLVFYFFGLLSIIWFFFWCLLCYEDPVSHPFISQREKNYLLTSISYENKGCEKNLSSPIPWKNILTSLPVITLTIAEAGGDWGFYVILTDMPKYMNDIMMFSLKQNGLLSCLPYFAICIVTFVTSKCADWIIKRKCLSTTVVRKLYSVIGCVGPSLCLICTSYVGCNRNLAVALLTSAMGLIGFGTSSLRVNALDLSYRYSGTIIAIVNGAGCICGMLTPCFIGFLTTHGTLAEWKIVFWISAIVMLVTEIPYVVFGSGKRQSWDKPQTEIKKTYRYHNTKEILEEETE